MSKNNNKHNEYRGFLLWSLIATGAVALLCLGSIQLVKYTDKKHPKVEKGIDDSCKRTLPPYFYYYQYTGK